MRDFREKFFVIGVFTGFQFGRNSLNFSEKRLEMSFIFTQMGLRVKNEVRIANLVQDYETQKEEGRIVEYLRAVGHNIQF